MGKGKENGYFIFMQEQRKTRKELAKLSNQELMTKCKHLKKKQLVIF